MRSYTDGWGVDVTSVFGSLGLLASLELFEVLLVFLIDSGGEELSVVGAVDVVKHLLIFWFQLFINYKLTLIFIFLFHFLPFLFCKQTYPHIYFLSKEIQKKQKIDKITLKNKNNSFSMI